MKSSLSLLLLAFTDLREESDAVDPPCLGKITDRTQPTPLDVLAIHLAVPEGFSRQRNKCVTLSLKYIRKAIWDEENM